MAEKYPPFTDPAQAIWLSSQLAQYLQLFLTPHTRQLNFKLDARLLRTFFATLIAIISFRERNTAHGSTGPSFFWPGLIFLMFWGLGLGLHYLAVFFLNRPELQNESNPLRPLVITPSTRKAAQV